MTRSGVVVILAAGMVASSAIPALAQPLEDWLERAAEAEFEGRQVTICDTPDGRLTDVIDVAQQDGVVVVRAVGGEVVIRSGSVLTTGADGAASLSTVESASGTELAARYQSSVQGERLVINRPTDVVEVREGDRVRLRYAFDTQTGAVLRSEVNNGDGTPYCTTQFVEFRPETVIDLVEPDGVRELLISALESEITLPATVAGFTQLDLYEGPHGSTAAFYSDGIFSFTVLVADRRIAVSELEEAPQVDVAGREYTRRFDAGQVVYSWESPDGGLVLIGDMPPDLQSAVLSELPAPGKVGFLARIWRRLFR